jgi:uncharacterized protein
VNALYPVRMISRLVSAALAAAALALGAGPARAAADAPVSITTELKGAWMSPEGAWDGRTVLMLHGFADDMDGAGDLTKHFAEDLSRHGIASLRINFRGEGDRRRTVIESTFTTRIEDAEAAYAWILRQQGVRPGHIGALGWSLGAATEIEILGRHPAWFRSGAVWSSPCGDLEKVMVAMPGAQQALKEGVTTQDAGWKKITTYRAFYESFRGIDLDRSLAKYPGAFLSVYRSSERHSIERPLNPRPPPAMDQTNKIIYVEFHASDLEKTRAFFEKVFGWTFTDYGPDYTSFVDGQIAGGFARSDKRAVDGEGQRAGRHLPPAARGGPGAGRGARGQGHPGDLLLPRRPQVPLHGAERQRAVRVLRP